MFAYATKLGFESDSFFRTIRDGVEHYVAVHELSEYQQAFPETRNLTHLNPKH